jgi:hypothetical protein
LVLYFDKDLETAPLMSDGRSIKKYFEDGWQTLPEQTRRYPSFIPCLPAYLPVHMKGYTYIKYYVV